ncbi:mediator of RNA polymerase II transcription complex subunit 8-domain-containing protein [Tuber brumale]|nr:mediator of RNA polymerase II transcription complex subunit 8-domain-containing protein [Tuber brumale]
MENPQRSLESTRARFNQLVSALTAFDIALRIGTPEQLPPWQTLQSHFNVLFSTLDSLSQTLNQQFPPPQVNTSALVSYPLPSFPANSQGIQLSISTLLNKKLNPIVQDWALRALNSPTVNNDDLWDRAREIVQEQQEERNWYDDIYSLEEREAGTEGIETGISEEKEEKEEAIPGLKLEAILRFMETGVVPADQPALPMAAMPGTGPMKR